MSRYYVKDIKLLITLLPTLQIFLSFQRSSFPEMLHKKSFVKIFAKFAGKHLCWSLFFKKKLTEREKRKVLAMFLVSFEKYIRTLIWKNAGRRLLRRQGSVTEFGYS